jgi:hypothetical protein
MKLNVNRFLLLLLCVGHPSFGADPFGFLEYVFPQSVPTRADGFLFSNERYPQDAESIWKEAGPGAYLAVGTERGFIGFAMSTGATHLVLLDVDTEVAHFNRANRALLAVASSRQEYVSLRTTMDSSIWHATALASPEKSEARRILSDPREFEFWTQARASQTIEGGLMPGQLFAALENPDEKSLQQGFFLKGNYLHDDVLFKRLHEAAREGRIHVDVVNLKQTKNFGVIIAALKDKGIPLSVLDISNTWWERFVTLQKTAELIKACGPIEVKGSLFLATAKFSGIDVNRWVYLAYPFSEISNLGGADTFMDLFDDLQKHLLTHFALNRVTRSAIIDSPGRLK